MHRISMCIVIAVLAAPVLLGQDLTGVWSCNDGGTYYVRQIEDEVWWFGESRDGSWANVFSGRRSGALVLGPWADVPKTDSRGSGMLVLRVVSKDYFVADQHAGFSGSDWKRTTTVRGLSEIPTLGGIVIDDVLINARVKAALAADSAINPFNIDVDTNDGVVTLQGRVEREGTRTRAEKLARQIAGVRRVVNLIRVGE